MIERLKEERDDRESLLKDRLFHATFVESKLDIVMIKLYYHPQVPQTVPKFLIAGHNSSFNLLLYYYVQRHFCILKSCFSSFRWRWKAIIIHTLNGVPVPGIWTTAK